MASSGTSTGSTPTWQIDPLSDMCIRATVNHAQSSEDWASVSRLPNALKNKIFDIAAKRNLVNDKNIGLLITESLETAILNECHLNNGSIEQLSRCRYLKRLDVSACFQLKDVNISVEEGLQHIFLNCKNLRRVNLTNCASISEELIVKLAENCKLLEHLNLIFCPKVGDKAVCALGDNCHFLAALKLVGAKVTHTGFTHLSESPCAAVLENLVLRDSGITSLGYHFPIQRFPKLKYYSWSDPGRTSDIIICSSMLVQARDVQFTVCP